EIKEKCRPIICRSPGFSSFEIDDLTKHQQQDLARSMLMYQHVDAMITRIESESLSTRSVFLTNLKNIRSTMKVALLDPSDFQRVNVPTWQGALTQLHHVFEEMEHRFTPDNYDHSKINTYRERLYETAQLRLQLLEGLKSIQSDESLDNDHVRLIAFSKMLVKIIKEFLSGPVSSFNQKMIHKLIVLNENITRSVSRNNDTEHSGVAGNIKKIALSGVVKLEVDEAHQAMTKLKAYSQAENSPTEINRIIFQKRFSCSDTSLESAAQQQFTRLDWLTTFVEKNRDEHHHLPAMHQGTDEHPTESNELLPEPIDSSALYYAKNAVHVKAFLANDQATSDLLECLRIKSERYSRVNTSYKFHRAFRSLAIQVARQVAEIMAANEVDYARLTQHRHGYAEFLSDVSDAQQLNLMKLLAAENVVAKALKEVNDSGLYVKNSEYRAILEKSLKDVHSHLPKMAMMDRDFEAFNQVQQAMQRVLTSYAERVGEKNQLLLDLKDEIDSCEIEPLYTRDTSSLCKHVTDKLVGLINESYQPGFFGSRLNKHLNNKTVLALFKIIEQVEHPIARGNSVYFNFQNDYLFKRLRYQINSVVMKDAQAAEECCRVRHLPSQSVA
ncbi:MAG: hypothetical protein CMF39_03195, partial [Legionellaceae bacterium]|nr:hypothetical protein [Legionellaceae bacterium]